MKNPEVIYWSYSNSQKNVWNNLQDARNTFETNAKKGSEPDIIIKTEEALFFIEAKLGANNNTVCKSENPMVQKKYERGGNNWFSDVFDSDFKTVAIDNKKYELFRFWLLGTWITNKLNLDFYLVNLVLLRREKNIEASFKKHIKKNQRRKFVRIAWENIYEHILDSNPPSKTDKNILLKYFRNKTIGYVNGNLQKAFSINTIVGNIR